MVAVAFFYDAAGLVVQPAVSTGMIVAAYSLRQDTVAGRARESTVLLRFQRFLRKPTRSRTVQGANSRTNLAPKVLEHSRMQSDYLRQVLDLDRVDRHQRFRLGTCGVEP
eukprot:646954-Rhodomonas_salina.2